MSVLPPPLVEHCATEIGRCYEIAAFDPDELDIITYSTRSDFFDVTKTSTGKANICLKRVFDREQDCIVGDDGDAYLPVIIRATKPTYGLFNEKEVRFQCDDINDHAPALFFSPQPHADTICTELGRNFSDTRFLEEHNIDPDDVDFSLDWDNNGVDVVAIAVVKDIDGGDYGNAYPFFINVETEGFEARSTNNPYVFLIVYSGDRDRLDAGEEVVMTVADAGLQKISKHDCLNLDSGPMQLLDHNGDAVKFILHACDCPDNEGI